MKRPALHKINYLNGGIQEIYIFENGYGASVVRHNYSYGTQQGLWELAVIRGNMDSWDICYTTPITSDVIGHLTEQEILEVLNQIENLPTLK